MSIPALLEPRFDLSKKDLERYSRHLLLPEFGVEGQRKLKTSKVLVVGAGGLGSPSLMYLAAAGIGTLAVIDHDTVDISNLQRQIIHGVNDLGDHKVESARRTIQSFNPLLKFEAIQERLSEDNAIDIISQYDLVLDGTDNFATRYLVNDACVLTKKPYVWGSIYRFEGQASVFWEQAPDGRGINYRDLYPAPPPPEHAPSCAEGGVLGVLCASIASIMATEAIKLLTGMGESLIGSLMVYDALDMSYKKFPIRRDPSRKPITALSDYEYFCGLNSSSENEEIPRISVLDLQKKLTSSKPPTLIDVREKTEWDIVHLVEAVHLAKSDPGFQSKVSEFSIDLEIYVMCKSGGRSRSVTQQLLNMGFTNVADVEGGILAWVKKIDPSMTSY